MVVAKAHGQNGNVQTSTVTRIINGNHVTLMSNNLGGCNAT